MFLSVELVPQVRLAVCKEGPGHTRNNTPANDLMVAWPLPSDSDVLFNMKWPQITELDGETTR